MKVAILSKMDHSGGGASRVAETLHGLLLGAGHQSTFHTVRDHAPIKGCEPVWPAWCRRQMAFLSAGSEVVGGQVFLPLEWFRLRRRLRGMDVVHVHDTWTAFSPWTLRWISRRYPTVLTLHDCSPFTGGCLYTLGCERFTKSCGSCPQKKEARSLIRRIDLTRPSQWLRRRANRDCRLSVVAPSRWMADTAERSAMFGPRVGVISNCTDTALYHPSLRETVRREMGIPPEACVVLVAATSLDDPRKGTRYAIEALVRSRSRGHAPLVLLMGGLAPGLQASLPFQTVSTGYVKTPARAAAVYACADILLFPSLADNQPQSIQEAMACGTPVVAFRSGGVAEMIRDGVEGFLCEPKNAASLETALSTLIADPAKRAAFGAASRARAVQEWSPETFLRNHLDHYGPLLHAAGKS